MSDYPTRLFNLYNLVNAKLTEQPKPKPEIAPKDPPSLQVQAVLKAIECLNPADRKLIGRSVTTTDVEVEIEGDEISVSIASGGNVIYFDGKISSVCYIPNNGIEMGSDGYTVRLRLNRWIETHNYLGTIYMGINEETLYVILDEMTTAAAGHRNVIDSVNEYFRDYEDLK